MLYSALSSLYKRWEHFICLDFHSYVPQTVLIIAVSGIFLVTSNNFVINGNLIWSQHATCPIQLEFCRVYFPREKGSQKLTYSVQSLSKMMVKEFMVLFQWTFLKVLIYPPAEGEGDIRKVLRPSVHPKKFCPEHNSKTTRGILFKLHTLTEHIGR
jgi:hypothetical protein